MRLFIYIQNFILSKLKKHPIPWFIHPNRNWKWIPLCDSNSRFQVIQTTEFELQVISNPSRIWNSHSIQFQKSFLCIQTKRKANPSEKNPFSLTFLSHPSSTNNQVKGKEKHLPIHHSSIQILSYRTHHPPCPLHRSGLFRIHTSSSLTSNRYADCSGEHALLLLLCLPRCWLG
jgi:hypothetical protein